jgi:CubicO group peptidase (beta-lactamase class C family)
MHFHSRVLLYSSLAGLGACLSPTVNEPVATTETIRYSDTYEPARFENGERKKDIGEALAESHLLYAVALEENHLPGVAYGLVVDDSLVFSGAFGYSDVESGTPATTQTFFRIASMSKSFTAMAILKLRDEGKLRLSDPAAYYVPDMDQLTYLTRDATPVTIFNLLTMTAGFPEDNPWGDRLLDISDGDLMKMVRGGLSFSTVPSLNYEYSNLGYGLLGHIITEISGVPFQEYITRNILLPLGMENTYYEYEDVPQERLAQGYRWENGQWKAEPMLHDGAFGSMGGLITTIEDFSKYISFHLSAWPPRSDPPDGGPVRRSTLREMHRLNNPSYLKDTKWLGNDTRPLIQGYGFGLRVIRDLNGVLEIGHGGGLPGFGSYYMFYPEYGVGIMAFGNLTYVGGAVKAVNYQVIRELIGQDLFKPRILPVSKILEIRKMQVVELITGWDPELEKDIVADNLYMDRDREVRIREARDLLERLGEIVSIGPLVPENQLRGSFLVYGTGHQLKVSFTLSPEAEPKIQWLTLELIPGS